jgi:dihydropteroate synthase
MKHTINCRGRLLDLSTPIVMGVINVNEDSFYADSRSLDADVVLEKASKMLSEGASILDLGAMSSRPGATIIDEETEVNRLIPVIRTLLNEFSDVIISIDTMHSTVAKACVEQGASIINDISAGNYDAKMMETVANLNVPYVMMHMQGLPSDMQLNPSYDDVVMDILKYFVKKVHQAKSLGIKDIILDPGFGFGKTLDHNYELMKSLEQFLIFEYPVLVGISRKSMINKLLNIKAADALNGTTVLHMFALQKGAKILRVHDVNEAVECIKIYQKLNGN